MGWSVFVDRGGTFTDVVARDPEGRLHVRKLLSEDPSRTEEAPARAIRDLLGIAPGAPLDTSRIDEVRMGTTVATNALLERRGSRVALLTTAGFEDALEIGTQARPDLFALEIKKPGVLHEVVIPVRERVLADGTVRQAPDLIALRPRLVAARASGIDAVAVVLVNAYAWPEHEQAVAGLCREVGFTHVAVSHEVAREIKLVPRGDTTTADAYLTPILQAYIDRVRRDLGQAVRLRFMQSSGGLVDAARFSGKDAVLSGPAGGVVAVAAAARSAGLPRVIGLDMGGTSTDVCRVDVAEGFQRVHERVVAGVRLKAPMLDVTTIAAGGGSLLRFDGRKLTVGPESAGAVPGPVCYRRPEGKLAVTDANAVLGRVQPGWFPACFGRRGDEPLDVAASERAMSVLAEEVGRITGQALSPQALAAGFVRIANDAMARAIREVSVARGYDVTEYALCSFGGAGAQHACALAEALGIRTVLLHPLAGVLSAHGIGLADVTHADVAPILRPLDSLSEARPPEAPGRDPAPIAPDAASRGDQGGLASDDSRGALEPALVQLEARGRAAVVAQGVPATHVRTARTLDLRYAGVDATLEVPVGPVGEPAALAAVAREFGARHRRLYGFERPGHAIEVVAARVETIGSASLERAASAAPGAADAHDVEPVARATVWFDRVQQDGSRRVVEHEVPVFDRRRMRPGARLAGPALVVEDASTIVVDPSWSGRIDACGNLLLEVTGRPARERLSTARDPVTLEVMGNLFMSIAEQMGRTLERVSLSVNMKERLDFSCAVFDQGGGLVANAPHIPVHLGAMGESVRAIAAARGGDLRPGDAFVTNDPYHGGSHLPDVTVVSPVFASGALAFWVASRGHHADIGGVVPGSMPPFSRRIEEEGVRIHDLLLVRDGAIRRDDARAALSAGPYPARAIDERLADLEAQVAANTVGVDLLGELAERHGAQVVSAYMRHVQDDAAEALAEALGELAPGTRRFFDVLDDGARIQVALTITHEPGTPRRGRALLDFAGTDARLPGNLNAPRAVVLACVLYVFRCLVPRPVPLNEGCFRPLEVRIPAGSLLAPEPPDAIVGGNVETSQRIVDVLHGALGKLAAGQGTMNNLTFGDATFGYYETIGGGAPAGLGFDGASAVHTHMTNTRITDVEVLERRCPVVVRRFAVRRGSGGTGAWRGGDGVVRALEMRAPVTCAILSERRAVGPWGQHGAGSGMPGRNRLHSGGRGRGPYGHGEVRDLPGRVRVDLAAGDVIEVETPGAGGYDPTSGEWASLSPERARALFRLGRWRGPTTGISARHVQANLVIVPARVADDLEAYLRKNPRPCPLLERLPAGSPFTSVLAAGADLRVDVPRYRRHRLDPQRGLVADDLEHLGADWRDDDVAFLLGCSFSLEESLLAAGVPVRHIEEGRNVPMYRTLRATEPVGPFGGPLVVSMRPMTPDLIPRAIAATEQSGFAHGAPIHTGDTHELGIRDLSRPEWGDAVTIRPGEVPVFWACGVTSQVALEGALRARKLERALTHAPGHMFVGDMTNDEARGRGLPLT